ncbi:hypothetical protein D9M68_452340 [compost metagenome]
MQHEAGLVALGIDFPDFLDAQAVGLRVAAFVELELGDQLAAQVAARAFGEHRVLAQQLHAELEVLGGFAVLADAHVAGGHAAHRAVLVVEHFGGREAGEDFHAEVLGLLRQPLGEGAQADDVVAVVLEAGRQEGVGRAQARLFAQEHHGVVGHGLVQRGAEFLPVGQQLVERARVHDGARQDVRAGLGTLLEHHDGDFLLLLGGELLEADRGREAGGAAADHDHVVFHGFARAELGEDFVVRHVGWVDNDF